MDKNMQGRRTSILKPSKIDGRDEEDTKAFRRVRFSSNFVKEFAPAANGEHLTVWDTTYEESIEKSSISSQSQFTLPNATLSEQINKENAISNIGSHTKPSSGPMPSKRNTFFPDFIKDPIAQCHEKKTCIAPAFFRKAAEKRTNNALLSKEKQQNDCQAHNKEDTASNPSKNTHNINTILNDIDMNFKDEADQKDAAFKTPPDAVFCLPSKHMPKAVKQDKRKSYFNSTAMAHEASFFGNNAPSPIFAEDSENCAGGNSKAGKTDTKAAIDGSASLRKTQIFRNNDMEETHILYMSVKPQSETTNVPLTLDADKINSNTSKSTRKTMHFNSTGVGTDMEMTLKPEVDEYVAEMKQSTRKTINFNCTGVGAEMEMTSKPEVDEYVAEMKQSTRKTINFNCTGVGADMEMTLEPEVDEYLTEKKLLTRKTINFNHTGIGADMEMTLGPDVIESACQQQRPLNRKTILFQNADMNVDVSCAYGPSGNWQNPNNAKTEKTENRQTIHFGNMDMEQTNMFDNNTVAKEIIADNISQSIKKTIDCDVDVKNKTLHFDLYKDEANMEQTQVNFVPDILEQNSNSDTINGNKCRQTVHFDNLDMEQTLQHQINQDEMVANIFEGGQKNRKTIHYEDFDMEQTEVFAPAIVTGNRTRPFDACVDDAHLDEMNGKNIEADTLMKDENGLTIVFGNADMEQTNVVANDVLNISNTFSDDANKNTFGVGKDQGEMSAESKIQKNRRTIHYEMVDMEQTAVFPQEIVDNKCEEKVGEGTSNNIDFPQVDPEIVANVSAIKSYNSSGNVNKEDNKSQEGKTIYYEDLDMEETEILQNLLQEKHAIQNKTRLFDPYIDDANMETTQMNVAYDNHIQMPETFSNRDTALKESNSRLTELFENMDMEQTYQQQSDQQNALAVKSVISVDVANKSHMFESNDNPNKTHNSRKTIHYQNFDMEETKVLDNKPLEQHIEQTLTNFASKMHMKPTLQQQIGQDQLQIANDSKQAQKNRKTIHYEDFDMEQTEVFDNIPQIEERKINVANENRIQKTETLSTTLKGSTSRQNVHFDNVDMEQTYQQADPENLLVKKCVISSQVGNKSHMFEASKTQHNRKTIHYDNVDMEETEVFDNKLHEMHIEQTQVNFANDNPKQMSATSSNRDTALKESKSRRTVLFDNVDMEQTYQQQSNQENALAEKSLISFDVANKSQMFEHNDNPNKTHTSRKTIHYQNFDMEETKVFDNKQEMHIEQIQSANKMDMKLTLQQQIGQDQLQMGNVAKQAQKTRKTIHYEDFDMEQTEVFSPKVVDNKPQELAVRNRAEPFDDVNMIQSQASSANDDILIKRLEACRDLNKGGKSRRTVLFENMDMEQTYQQADEGNEIPKKSDNINKIQNSRKTIYYENSDMEETDVFHNIPQETQINLANYNHNQKSATSSNRDAALKGNNSRRTVLFDSMDMEHTYQQQSDQANALAEKSVISLDVANKSQMFESNYNPNKSHNSRKTIHYQNFDMEETEVFDNKPQERHIEQTPINFANKIDMKPTLQQQIGQDLLQIANVVKQAQKTRKTIHYEDFDMDQTDVFENVPQEKHLEQTQINVANENRIKKSETLSTTLKGSTSRQTVHFDNVGMDQTLHPEIDQDQQRANICKDSQKNRKTIHYEDLDMEQTEILQNILQEKHDIQNKTLLFDPYIDDANMETTQIKVDNDNHIQMPGTSSNRNTALIESKNRRTVLFENKDMEQTYQQADQENALVKKSVISSQVGNKSHMFEASKAQHNRKTIHYDNVDMKETEVFDNKPQEKHTEHTQINFANNSHNQRSVTSSNRDAALKGNKSRRTVLFENMDMEQTYQQQSDQENALTEKSVISSDVANKLQMFESNDNPNKTHNSRKTIHYQNFDMEETEVFDNKPQERHIEQTPTNFANKIDMKPTLQQQLGQDQLQIATFAKQAQKTRKIIHYEDFDMEQTEVFKNVPQEKHLEQTQINVAKENRIKKSETLSTTLIGSTSRRTAHFDNVDMEQTLHPEIDQEQQRANIAKDAQKNRKTIYYNNFDMEQTEVFDNKQQERHIEQTSTNFVNKMDIKQTVQQQIGQEQLQIANVVKQAQTTRKTIHYENFDMEQTGFAPRVVDNKPEDKLAVRNKAEPLDDVNMNQSQANVANDIFIKHLEACRGLNKGGTSRRTVLFEIMDMEQTYQQMDQEPLASTSATTRNISPQVENSDIKKKAQLVDEANMEETRIVPDKLTRAGNGQTVVFGKKQTGILEKEIVDANNMNKGTNRKIRNNFHFKPTRLFSQDTDNSPNQHEIYRTLTQIAPVSTDNAVTREHVEETRQIPTVITTHFDDSREIPKIIKTPSFGRNVDGDNAKPRKSLPKDETVIIVDEDDCNVSEENEVHPRNINTNLNNESLIYDVSSDVDNIETPNDTKSVQTRSEKGTSLSAENRLVDSYVEIIDTSDPNMSIPQEASTCFNRTVADMLLAMRPRPLLNNDSSVCLLNESVLATPQKESQTTGVKKRELSQCSATPAMVANKRFDDKRTPLAFRSAPRAERTAPKRSIYQSPSSTTKVPLKKVDHKQTPAKANPIGNSLQPRPNAVDFFETGSDCELSFTTPRTDVAQDEMNPHAERHLLFHQYLDGPEEEIDTIEVPELDMQDFSHESIAITNDNSEQDSIRELWRVEDEIEVSIRRYFDRIQISMLEIAEENQILLLEDFRPTVVELTLVEKIEKKANSHSEYKLLKLQEDSVTLLLLLEEIEITMQFKKDTGCVVSFDIVEACPTNPNAYTAYTLQFYKHALHKEHIYAAIGKFFSILSLMDYLECQLAEFGVTLMAIFHASVEFNARLDHNQTLTYRYLTMCVDVIVTLDLSEWHMEKIQVKPAIREGAVSMRKLQHVVESVHRDRKFPRNVIAAITEYLHRI